MEVHKLQGGVAFKLLRNQDIEEFFSTRLASMDKDTIILQDSIDLTLTVISKGI